MSDSKQNKYGSGTLKPDTKGAETAVTACLLARENTRMDMECDVAEPVVLVERIDRAKGDASPVPVSRGSSFKRSCPGPLSSKRNPKEENEDDDSRFNSRLVYMSEDETRTDSDASSIASLSSYASHKPVKRKRGQLPTTGEYVGRAAALKELARKERELLALQAQRELVERVTEARVTQSMGPPSEPAEVSRFTPAQQRGKKEKRSEKVKATEVDVDSISASEIRKMTVADAKLAMDLVTRSKNLKGTFQRALKKAAISLERTVTSLAGRSQSEEITRLETESKNLRREMSSLRGDLEEIKRTMDALRRRARRIPSRSPPPAEASAEMVGGGGQLSLPHHSPSDCGLGMGGRFRRLSMGRSLQTKWSGGRWSRWTS